MQRTDSFEKTLMLGKIEGGREEDNIEWTGWLASPTQCTWIWVNSGIGDGQGGLACCGSWGQKESDTIEQLNWTELMGLDAMILVFWMLNFKPTFSLFSFTFKRLFSSSSLSALRVVLSAYLRLLVFLPAILIPSCVHPAQYFSCCILHIT